MDGHLAAAANNIAGFVGSPLTFILALSTVIVWGATGPLFRYSDTWQLVINTSTAIITFVIVFLIYNSQNRDAAAIPAKLDEIIRTVDGARDSRIGIEHLTEKQLRTILAALEKECDDNNSDRHSSHGAVERLLVRT